MAIDYSRLPRDQVEQSVVRMSFDARANELRALAVRSVNDYNELASNKLSEADFNGAVVQLASKLSSPVPSVPSDLSGLSDTQLASLAAALEKAEWDYNKRSEMLTETRRYWTAIVQSGGASPTPAQYLTSFITMTNYVRAARGLAPIT